MGVTSTALTRVRAIAAAAIKAATEGEWRAGPWPLPITGGFLTPDAPSYGRFATWWQHGGSVVGAGARMAIVEACVSAYAQTAAMCPGAHWLSLENGGRQRITNSALSRILKKPNEYQTPSDFMLNATRSLYLDGNAYALALRNDRFEIEELHLMDSRQSTPLVAETGDVFYRLGGNSVIDRQRIYDERLFGDPRSPNWQLIVPQRDVLHIRLHSIDRWPFPLLGDTPLMAALMDIAWYESIRDQQGQFFGNQARPSAVITTDLVLDKNEVDQLRQRWNDQAKGLHSGGVPILTSGLKVVPWTEARARDMQVAEQLKMTQDQIALVFRIPLAILGIEKAGASTEALINQWLASGLGFCLNHIEEAFDRLFRLKGQPDEYTELSTEALLRSAQKERIDMLVRGVQGGVFAPNEARAKEDLPAVDYGDEPRTQQQVVPLSAAAGISAAPPAAGVPPAAGQPAPTFAPKSYDDRRRCIESELLNSADCFDQRRVA